MLAGDRIPYRWRDQKYVFVFGLCDGSFPSAPSDGGLINDRDREIFEKADVHIGIHSHDKYLYELFTAYSALTSASEHVSLSYPCVFNGETLALVRIYGYAQDILSLSPGTAAPQKTKRLSSGCSARRLPLALGGKDGL